MTFTLPAEYHVTNEPVLAPLTWLLQNINHSGDFGEMETVENWEYMMSSKCNDTGFGHLVESMMENGHLPEGAIGFCNGNITEGHHRICAAILLGFDEVWISRWGSEIRQETGRGRMLSAHENTDDPYPIAV
jgi:hypothetical protein